MAITNPNVYNGPVAIPSKEEVKHKYIIIDDKVHEIKRIVVHQFTMGDVEDPDLYAAEPLLEWQNSESGKWIMQKAVDTPEWHRFADPITYGYRYSIVAKLKDIDYTFWQLKWGQQK